MMASGSVVRALRMLRGRGGGAADAFGALARAGMSSSSSSGGVTDLAAVAARSTPAEQKHLGALQGAMLSARAELEKRAAQNVSLDWSKFDQKSESIKALKAYYEGFKPPPVDASIVADLKKKFDAVEKALEADAKAAKLEIATIEKELEKLNFELVRLLMSDRSLLDGQKHTHPLTHSVSHTDGDCVRNSGGKGRKTCALCLFPGTHNLLITNTRKERLSMH